jgi:hypothetical protein
MIGHVRILKNYVQELHVDTDIGTKSLWLKCWQARAVRAARTKTEIFAKQLHSPWLHPCERDPSESGGIALEDKQGKFVWDYAAPRV